MILIVYLAGIGKFDTDIFNSHFCGLKSKINKYENDIEFNNNPS